MLYTLFWYCTHSRIRSSSCVIHKIQERKIFIECYMIEVVHTFVILAFTHSSDDNTAYVVVLYTKNKNARFSSCVIHLVLMMIAFITFKSSLVPLFEGPWSSNSWEFELSGFRRNRTDDLGIDSPGIKTKMHNILCVLFLISSAICILLWILFETRTQQKELKQKWIRTTRVIWK